MTEFSNMPFWAWVVIGVVGAGPALMLVTLFGLQIYFAISGIYSIFTKSPCCDRCPGEN